MTTLSCAIPDRLNSLLEAAARRERASKQAIVRQALERRLLAKNGNRSQTAFAVVKHLAGTLHGPADLSTNPEHLVGLGA